MQPIIPSLFTRFTFSIFIIVACADNSFGDNWDSPAIKWHPTAKELETGRYSNSDLINIGRSLFQVKFNILDGAGRPGSTGDSKPTIRIVGESGKSFNRVSGPDASSCFSCHNQSKIGGSGDFSTNVFVGAHLVIPYTESIADEVTNERNTTSLFGAGVVELLSKEITYDLHKIRDSALQEAKKKYKKIRKSLHSKGISFGYIEATPDGLYSSQGIEGVDADLIIKPFGVKGVAVSIREFTNFALNQHHGIQSVERFGWQRTGSYDFDQDGVDNEFSTTQVSSLVLFQASLPIPTTNTDYRKNLDSDERALGKKLFKNIGCTSCHISKLPLYSTMFLEPNEFNRPGSATPIDIPITNLDLRHFFDSDIEIGEDGAVHVEIYTDFKRHVICDNQINYFCNEKIVQDFVPPNEFMTSRLWDVGSTAPYGHRGDLTTISEAILNHGGEANESRENFLQLNDKNKIALVKFLESMQN